MVKHKLRILHTPNNVGGHPSQLSKSENNICLKSSCVTTSESRFQYTVDKTLAHKFKPFFYLNRLWWAVWKIHSFDVIHYNFGCSLMSLSMVEDRSIFKKLIKNFLSRFELWDVAYAKIFGKRIVVTYQGDDARLGRFCRDNFPVHFAHEVDSLYYTDNSDKWKTQRISKFERYADLIFSLNPDLMHTLPIRTKFMPYASVDIQRWKFIGTRSGADFIPHVVHAPSHIDVKGTKYIEIAVNELKKEGLEFKFTLVSGMTNAEAKQVYETADILIDQILAGFYGGVAVEAMALGKPVISYLRTGDFKFLPPEMVTDMPIINASPETIKDVLRDWIGAKKNLLHLKGIESRRYVEKWHDPHKIAEIALDEYISN